MYPSHNRTISSMTLHHRLDIRIISVAEVHTKLNKINIKKVNGPDNIPNWIIRDSASNLAASKQALCVLYSTAVLSLLHLLWPKCHLWVTGSRRKCLNQLIQNSTLEWKTSLQFMPLLNWYISGNKLWIVLVECWGSSCLTTVKRSTVWTILLSASRYNGSAWLCNEVVHFIPVWQGTTN